MTLNNGENSVAGTEDTNANPGGDTSKTTVDDLESRLNALSTQISGLRDELHEEREQRHNLERQLKERDERINDLEIEVARLDARTDMLELVENADQMDARQRAVTLIQHLHRAVQARKRRDEPAAASVNRDDAEEALHYPDVERTTIYRDMERAARLVGNSAVLAYKNGELTLDLESGDLPQKYTGEQGGGSL